MPRTARGWEITPAELKAWTLFEDERVLVLDKPGLVVCHPFKFGPWSSLAGACREYLGLDRVHLPVRLDRETSGVVVVCKDQATGVQLHTAMSNRAVRKSYLAILKGTLSDPLVVNAPLGREAGGVYTTRQWVLEQGGREAVTEYAPISWGGGFTLVRVTPHTGRMHQIRVHAAYAGYPVLGDKLYSCDPALMLKFIESGFTAELKRELLVERQALHAAELVFCLAGGEVGYRAPLPLDMVEFCDAMNLQHGT